MRYVSLDYLRTCTTVGNCVACFGTLFDTASRPAGEVEVPTKPMSHVKNTQCSSGGDVLRHPYGNNVLMRCACI